MKHAHFESELRKLQTRHSKRMIFGVVLPCMVYILFIFVSWWVTRR